MATAAVALFVLVNMANHLEAAFVNTMRAIAAGEIIVAPNSLRTDDQTSLQPLTPAPV